ncbi:hypothetical protein LTR84_009008 [Exophiala bonariae]|uniref:Prion-inhibition and propagation HeLo domain-containing protein n=1 Tax=Exophiala bonariae TaxID=1690606 RepID=A0AAV9MYP7_9EURO|nr:hypothetical protein LTR84_009008 [Exophiala bonariae]
MAEVAGLLVGVVPLISCFKDCVDLFSYISLARSLGRDYELLNTKLDVEKLLLLQWSSRIQLFQSRPDKRLDDPLIQEMITKVLKSIARLLSDGKDLRTRYGLRKERDDLEDDANSDSDAKCESDDDDEFRSVAGAPKAVNGQRRPPLPSDSRLDVFIAQFDRLKLQKRRRIDRHTAEIKNLNLKLQDLETRERLEHVRLERKNLEEVERLRRETLKARTRQQVERVELQKVESLQLEKISPTRRIRWAVHDRDKFDNLVQDLSYFIRKLNEIVPDNQHSIEEMTAEDLADLPDSRVELVFQVSRNRATTMATVAKDVLTRNCENRILRSLKFRYMDDRMENISTPSSNTFEWALQPREADVQWDDLTDWFRSDAGIYWISGKAGSGKSVLMKYICSQDRTQQLLGTWACDAPLTVAQFFFWALAPTVEQRSLGGLSRALLHRILEEDRSLIPRLMPGMWEEAYAKDIATVSPPSPAEMKSAFEILGRIPNYSRKFCFFIDGLDEYDGNLSEGIAFLKNLASNPSVKLVVSSRPLASCVEAFSTCPMLQMQDLTESDISAYVDEAIATHPHMLNLLNLHPSGTQQILKTIVNKSSGVFLWVVLACRSIREGLDAADDISDLRRRLDELPPELRDLFAHMLSNIHSRYRLRAAKYIRVLYACKSNPDTDELSSLGLALMEAQEMGASEFHPMDDVSFEDKRWRVQTLEKRLSCCCGLLEVRVSRNHSKTRCFCDRNPENRLLDSQIDFIHRSVYEFLSLPGTLDLEALQVRDESFDPNAILAYMSVYLAGIKLKEHGVMTTPYLRDVLMYGLRVQKSSNDKLRCLMEELAETWLKSSMSDNAPWNIGSESQTKSWIMDHESQANNSWDNAKATANLTLLLCIEAGMTDLIEGDSLLAEQPSFRPTRFPLLYHALSTPLLKYRWNLDLPMPLSTVRFLLSRGYDPNELLWDERIEKQISPWEYYLEILQNPQNRSTLLANDLIEEFLRAGANCAEWCEAGPGVPNAMLTSVMRRAFCLDGGRLADDESILSRADLRTLRDRGNQLLRVIRQHQSEQIGRPDKSTRQWQQRARPPAHPSRLPKKRRKGPSRSTDDSESDTATTSFPKIPEVHQKRNSKKQRFQK